MDTTVSTPQAVATVIAVEGQAYARNPAGEMRPLKAGDVLLEGDTVVTLAGGHVELAFPDGHRLALLPDESFRFTPETTPAARPDTAEAALPAGEAERILQALERGEDIDAQLEDTAAGLEGGGNNAGNDFVRLLRIVEGLDPLNFAFDSAATETVPVFDPEGGGAASDTVTPTPVVGTVSLAAVPSVSEGGTVIYTATVDVAPQGSPLVLTLSNGVTITIPIGAVSGTSTPVPVRTDDVHVQGTVAVTVNIDSASGGDYTTLSLGAAVATDVSDTTDATTVSLAATATVAEGGSIVYTASVDHAAETPVTLTLSNGATITIPAGASSGSVSIAAPTNDAYVDAGSVSVVVTSATGGNFESLIIDATPAVTAIVDTVDTSTVTLTASASVAEGGSIVYSASLNSPAQTAVSITLSNGAAIAIAAGASTGSVSVPAPGDDVYVDGGIVSATITSATGGNFENLVVDPAPATTAITDTLDVTTVSLTASASVAEGGAIVYTASLTQPAQIAVSVTLSNGFGVTIPAGVSNGAVSVPAPSDDVYLDALSVSVSITSAIGGSFEQLAIDPTPATTAISDTLDTTTLSLTASPTVAEGGSIVYTASLTQPAQTSVSVALSNGFIITIPAGASSGAVAVPAPGDDVYLDAANVSATIASANGGNYENLVIDPAPAVTSISDTFDVSTVTLTATPAVAEGGTITYTASLSAVAQTPVSVVLSNGATITIPAGTSSGSTSVPAPGDDVYVDDGSVSVTIASAAGGNFESLAVDPMAAVTAVSDTLDTTTVSLTATPAVAEGGSITYVATLTSAAQSAVTVTLANGASIAIAAGASTGSVAVAAPADTAYLDAGNVSTTIVSTSGGNFENLTVDAAPAVTTVSDTSDVTTVALSATASVAEGGSITYVATVDRPAQTPLSVTLSNGATITIAAGTATGSVSVAAPGDDVYLDAVSIDATIVSATGGNFESLAIDTTPASTSIVDTFDVATVSLSGSANVAEGGAATYQVSLSQPAQTAVTINLAYGGSATEGSDYTGVASVTIPAGSSSAAFSIPLATDLDLEGAETLVVSIASASGGNFENLTVDATATSVTTQVGDSTTSATLSLGASATVAEGGTITYTATLTAPALAAMSVTLSNGATIAIAGGASSGSVVVAAPADDVYLDAGSVSATIASVSGGGFSVLAVQPTPATTTISDTLDAVTASLAASASVAEGGVITYTASLNAAAQTPVNVTLSNGAALTIAAGASAASVSVAAPGDDVYVDVGSVSATITAASGGNFENLIVDAAPAITAITDTENTTTVSLSADAAVAEGGSITYTASLTQAAATPVTVTLSNGAVINIAAGAATGSVSIAAPTDDAYLDSGSVSATIASASGGNFERLDIDPVPATTTINDTVDTTLVSLDATASVAEGGMITYTANLSHPADAPVSITLSNGATISIASGASSGSASVAAPADDVYLDAGGVTATISAATGGNFENLVIDATPAATSITDTIDVTTVSLTATATVAEGGNILYTASLTAPAVSPVTITLSNGAAINIAAGAAAGSVSVSAPGDDGYLDASTVSATIASAAGGNFESLVIDPTPAATSVTDTLGVTTVSLTASANVAEGGNITYTASLSNAAQTAVSVALSNGAFISIAAGASSGAVSVPAPADDVYTDAGSVSAAITSATGGNFESLVIVPAPATTAITDTVDTTIVSLTASASVAEGGSIVYTASLNNVAQAPVSVTLTNGATIAIAAGSASGSVSVAAPADDVYLDAVSVSASISSAAGGNFEQLTVDGTPAVTAISDTLDVTTLSLTASASVAEGGNILYTASLDQPAGSPVTVTLSNGEIIGIAAGASSGTVSVAAPADDAHLDAGVVSATIASATGGNFENLTIQASPATTSISDTIDTTTVSLTATVSVAEGGSIVYTASLNNVAQTAVSVVLSNGATISIAAGAASGNVSVPAPADDVYVDAGSVNATIVSASGGNFENLVVNPTAAVTTVTDTLDATTVSLSASASVAEGGSIVYTASLTQPAQTAMSVVVSNGATIVIAAGSASGSVSVAAPTDDVHLDAGVVSASITSATGGNFENLLIDATVATTSITDTVDVTTVSLSADAAVAEGGAIVYTASLSNAAQSPVTITLSNGASVVIAAGASSGSVTVSAPADDAYVDAGNVSVTIASATGGNFETLLIDPTAAVTAVADTVDTTTVSLTATASVAEGGSIVYTASLNQPAGAAVTVTLSNGTTIQIAAGQSMGSASVAAPSDDVYVDAGTVSASIASVTGGNFENLVINPAAATTSITDTLDVTTVSLTASANVAEGGSILYTASLDHPAETTVSVALSNGATISIAAGTSSGSVSVAAPADDSYVDAGAISTTIVSATGGNFESLVVSATAATTVVTDTLDATTVSLTATPSVAEGGSILYTASLDNAAQAPVTVTLSNGATITIAAGASSGTTSVAAPGDDVYLDVGSISASIASAFGGNFESLIVNPAAAATAIGDTLDVTTVSLTATPTVAEGGSISYTANLDHVAETPVTVVLSNGATITVAAGAAAGTVTLPAPANDAYLNAGSVSATIASATGGNFESLAINPAAATTAITDTLDTTTVSLAASASVAEGGSIVYTASLSNPAGAAVSVTLSNGAAIAIAAGASTGSVSVAAPSDDVYVDAGAVTATISSATGGNFEQLAIDASPATTIISDTNDTTTLSLTASASVAEGGSIVYTASLDSPADTAVSVTLSNGAVIAIAAGASTGSVSFSAPSDDVYVAAGSVSATITSATGGNFEQLAINPAAATTTIVDTLDTTTVSLTASASVAEGGSIVYTASFGSPAAAPVSVTLSNGAVIAIAAGASTGSVSFPAPSDDVYVDAGAVSATIASATGGNFESLAINPAAATTAVTDTLDPTTVSLSASASVAEGGSIVYTASLDNVAQSPVSVTLSNGATISIAAGASTGSVSVPAPSDDVYVDAGSVAASIASASGGGFESLAINPAPATTSVTDTLDTTTISISGDGSVTEGSSASYTVSLTSPAQSAVTVNLGYSGTAANGIDYTGMTSVTIPAGASSASFSLATINDVLAEGTEGFTVSIAGASGGNFEHLVVSGSNSSVSTSLLDDDVTSLSLSATPTISEAGGPVVYTATASQVSASDITLTLSNGASITIVAGQTTGSISVAVAPGDDVYNDPDSLSVSISTATGGGGMVSIDPTPAITAITDTLDTTTVSLSASASVAEGGSIIYTASVDHPAQTPVTVNLSNGAVITIATGASTGSVSIPAPADDVYTDAGSISASITSATGGNFESLAVDSAPATTAITDTIDVATVGLTASASVAEGGNIVYTASLSHPAGTPVSVTLSNGAVIAIAAGASTGSVSVAAPSEDVYVDAGSVSATITSATGGNFESLAISPLAATTTIADTLDTTTVSLTASATVAEGGTVTYTASLTSVTQTPVDVVLSNGATITIAAGASSGSVAVSAPSDDVYLDAGSISATIASASGGNFESLAVNAAAAITTVTDTPDTTTLSLTASASVAEGGNILYTANLTSAAETPVNVTLSNGATITIAAGASSGSVSVPAPADDVYVDADVVSALIASASGGNFENLAIDTTPAATTITDTIAVTTVSLTATANVAEGGNITYTASLNNVAQTPVNVTLSNGAVITVAAGASTGSVAVLAPTDDVYVDAGSVSTTIASASGGNFESLAINSAAAVTAISDTVDTTTVSLTADVAMTEGGSIVYTASLNNVAATPVTITLSNGAVIAIAAGASSGSVSVAAPSDDAYVDAGSVSATIVTATGGDFEQLAIDPTAATTAVGDSVDVTTVSLAATASIAEGGSIVYTATLTNAAQAPISVTLSNGATIAIAAGASSGSVSVPAPSDDVYVDAGAVSATIASATGGNFESLVVDPQAATTAITDTVDVTTLSLTASPAVAEGGAIVYTATLNQPAGTPLTVTLSNGATITIAAGASSGATSVAAPTDDVYLDTGSVSASISSAVGGNFEILSVDTVPAVTAVSDTVDATTVSLTASASVAEGGAIVYTASLTHPAQTPVSVVLSNGATITIAAGASSGATSVPAPTDDVYVDASSVSATITSATGGNFETLAINAAAATTTITDTLDTTTVSLTASASVAEGGSIVYTASLDSPAGAPVSVTLSNGAVIAIAAGASTGSVSVLAPADDVYVDAGSVSATITAAADGNFEQLAINASAATTTITDTADTTTISLTGDAGVAEGAAASYTVSLTSPAQTDVTVNLAYSGMAANGVDFAGVASVTILAGASSAGFSLATLDDALVEGVESFAVAIASASGGNFENLVVSGSANTVTTTVSDNDVTTLSVSSPSVAEDGGYAQFTVTLSNPSSQSTSVGLALADGSATGADYGPVLEVSIDGGATWAVSNVAILPAMQTSLLVRTPINHDALDEANETFSLTATRLAGTPVTNVGGEATGTATIVDDDATPSLSIDSVTVNEGAGTATFTVTLSAASGQAVTVDYATGNGTALSGAGNDYTATSGKLTFTPGTTSQTITVPILNDAVYEGAESFNVALSGAINASIAAATGVGTILDNGSGAGGSDNDTPTLTVSNATVAESGGYAQFTVSLSNASTSAVVFTPSLASGTALLGTDTAAANALEVSLDNGATWTAVSGNVSIAAGSTSALLRIAVSDDALVEGAERFALTATVIGGGTLNASATGTATISDDDAIVVGGITADDDDVNENRDALAGNDIVHAGAIGNVATSVTLAIDDAVASGLTSSGQPIDYTWDGASRTLTASTASGTVFTVTLNASNDGYSYTQVRGVDHPALAGEGHSIAIPLTLIAQDANGTPFTSSVFNVTLLDDAPSVSASKTIVTDNDGSYVESGFLAQATVSNDVTQVSWNTASLPALVFDGKTVLYVDDGNGTLTGQLADGTLIFRATIDPTQVDANNHPQYSFELLNPLGRLGMQDSETSYTVISGGNISNLDLSFGGYLVDSMTAVDGLGVSTTVNTNNNWIGLGGNWFNPGERLLMAFSDVSGNAGEVRGMNLLVEGQGSAPYTVDWTVTAAIDQAGNTITYSGTVTGTGNDDIPFSIPLSGGALYFTNLEVSAPAGSGEFRIALSGISANDYFSDIPLALNYTLTDADGDSASGQVDVTLTASNAAPLFGTSAATATVSEEGLTYGLADTLGSPADTTNATVITGSMAISDPDGPAPTVTLDWPGTPPALTSGGVAVSWSGAGTGTLVGSANGVEVVRIAIANDGSYTVTLSKAVDHAAANVEDVLAFDVQVRATDGTATTTGTLTVNVEDDSAAVGNLTQAVTVPQQDTNLMLIVDVSGSMSDPSGITGQTRLQAAKAAINQLIDSYDGLGDVAVRVVYFSTGADWSGSAWVDATTGKTQINALSANGYTNYDAALADAMTAFGHSGKIAGAQNVSYFLSDGEPTYSNGNVNTLSDSNRTGNSNSDEGIQAGEETIWTNFLNTNDVKSYAIGIGTGLPSNAQTLLNPIAYDGTAAGTNTNATIVTNMAQLSGVLQATVPPATTGNLLTGNIAFGSGSGADGGYMPAITLDGTTYTYDAGAGTIAVSGSGGAGYAYDAATHALTITTAQGGSLTVDMDNGAYAYTPATMMSGTVSEAIGFSMTDADGDTGSGMLTLNVSREGATLTGTSSANTLVGTTGADVIAGGAGNDTLSGLLGGDTFKWSLADQGTSATPARDTILDFDAAIASDKLDLRDLLQGESHSGTDAGNLADYLHFSYDTTTSTTVVEVKSQGATMTGPDQIINLTGVDLVTGYTSDQQIIQDLLSKGKLITD